MHVSSIAKFNFISEPRLASFQREDSCLVQPCSDNRVFHTRVASCPIVYISTNRRRARIDTSRTMDQGIVHMGLHFSTPGLVALI